jgi:uncharacterized membrane protein YqaE (UPF0057 family)
LAAKPQGFYTGAVALSLLIRIILCFIFPPLAVADQGCGAFMVVFFLTLLGWVPGTVAALVIAVSKDKK